MVAGLGNARIGFHQQLAGAAQTHLNQELAETEMHVPLKKTTEGGL